MKPKTLSELKHGNLLTEGNYPTFVETFNYAVKRLDNLLGDKDVNPQTGTIRVDNTDPEHPVIRCDKPIPNGNGGGAAAFGDSDLSGVGLSSVHVADLSGTSYIQLYKFDETPTEQVGAKIDNPQGTFEIGSGDWFLVKNGNELHYKKIVLSTDLSGGGGGGGSSGAFSYDETTHKIYDGMFLLGRQYIFPSDVTVFSGGWAYLSVNMYQYPELNNGVVTGASAMPNPAVTSAYTCIPLYYFNSDLTIEHDYRGGPTIPIWES